MYTHLVQAELTARREKLGFSQAALAAKIQTLGYTINQQRISDWESGRARIGAEVLPYLAAALHCTPNDLVRWDHFRATL